MKGLLEYVTNQPDLWKDSDPVRPELTVKFKTTPGRGVFGLKGDDGNWKAFMCYARTTAVPRDVDELAEFTEEDANIIIPYTVWSHEKGAGRTIINEVLNLVRDFDIGVERVVTLSPITEMARKFHLRNKAVELRKNENTVNFEYRVNSTKEIK